MSKESERVVERAEIDEDLDVSEEAAEAVKGGAMQGYLTLEGTKQGKSKGELGK